LQLNVLGSARADSPASHPLSAGELPLKWGLDLPLPFSYPATRKAYTPKSEKHLPFVTLVKKGQPCLPSVGSFVALAKKDSEGGSAAEGRYENLLVEISDMIKDEQIDCFNAAAGVLIRCFVLAVCLLLFSFVFYLLAGDWAYCVHSKWFDLTRQDFDLMYYYVLASFKIAAFLFFLIPYIAIKLTLRKK